MRSCSSARALTPPRWDTASWPRCHSRLISHMQLRCLVSSHGFTAPAIQASAQYPTLTQLLAKKMTVLYKLAAEQLSKQHHYDFGLRALKSVLVMAGALKRGSPGMSEQLVLMRALRDMNLPKFVYDDVPLFLGLVSGWGSQGHALTAQHNRSRTHLLADTSDVRRLASSTI